MCEHINGAIIQEDFTMEKTIYDESNGLWDCTLILIPMHPTSLVGCIFAGWGASHIMLYKLFIGIDASPSQLERHLFGASRHK